MPPLPRRASPHQTLCGCCGRLPVPLRPASHASLPLPPVKTMSLRQRSASRPHLPGGRSRSFSTWRLRHPQPQCCLPGLKAAVPLLGQFSKCKVNILFGTKLFAGSGHMVGADNQAHQGALCLGLFALRFVFRILDVFCSHMPADSQHFIAFKFESVEQNQNN